MGIRPKNFTGFNDSHPFACCPFAGCHFTCCRTRSPPARFLIHGRLRKSPQRVNSLSIRSHSVRRQQRAGRLVHERHKFIRKSRHRATNTDPSHVGTAANSIDPTPLSNIALNHGPPAPQFHNTLARAILFRELGLLVISAAIATFVNGLAEKPSWPQDFIEGNHGCTTGGLIQKIK